MSILITGGAGFIGSHFVLHWLAHCDESVIILDKLTYASNLDNLDGLRDDRRFTFIKGSIGDEQLVSHLCAVHRPRAILNFAAESHVDRSIAAPKNFIETNIVDTFILLDVIKTHWEKLIETEKAHFRFLHVSTDEVYGSLEKNEPAFTEKNCYKPNSPYSASKAASDHLVRAYHHTYGLPVLTTHSSNNYGPHQYPEKLIPLIIQQSLAGNSLPIYGDGQQIRDWLYVVDHCRAIQRVLESGSPGQCYNIGGENEKSNLDVVHTLCDLLDVLKPRVDKQSYRKQITFVQDRLGHDTRYAIDATKLKQELDWKPVETFVSGIQKTVQWYLDQHERAFLGKNSIHIEEALPA